MNTGRCSKDGRLKKEPDEMSTPSIESTPFEAPAEVGTHLDDDLDRKDNGKNHLEPAFFNIEPSSKLPPRRLKRLSELTKGQTTKGSKIVGFSSSPVRQGCEDVNFSKKKNEISVVDNIGAKQLQPRQDSDATASETKGSKIAQSSSSPVREGSEDGNFSKEKDEVSVRTALR